MCYTEETLEIMMTLIEKTKGETIGGIENLWLRLNKIF